MLNSLKYSLKQLKLSSASYSKWKYVENSPSLSRAEKLKNLQKENKLLYGAAIKKKSKKNAKLSIEDFQVKEVSNKNDLSSEIYWQCHHVPDDPPMKKVKPSTATEKQRQQPTNPNDPLNLQGLMKIMESSKPRPASSVNYADEISDTKINKKLTLKKFQPELPESLNKLQASLPFSNSREFESSQHDEELNSENQQPIPMSTNQLRAIQQFPIILAKNNKTISMFEDVESLFHPMPSVSKVLQSTMPYSQRQALINWKNLKIAELGVEGFEALQKSHLARGKEFHNQIHKHFDGKSVNVLDMSPDVTEIWMSIEPLLDQFQVPATLAEQKIRHPYLCYHGIVDCVSSHNSSLAVIEWKKSDRHKKSLSHTFDAPIQLCSYIGALNASREEFKKNPIKHGIVVVAYSDGQKADLFELNESEMKKYWKLWLSRLQEFWVRYRDNTLPNDI